MASRAPRVPKPFVEIAPGDGMVNQLGQVWSRLFAVHHLGCLESQSVKAHASNTGQLLVERVADKDVREAETARRAGHVGHN